MTTTSTERWVEVTASQFRHEAEGLRLVRALLPDEPPFRAWSNFEFRDGRPGDSPLKLARRKAQRLAGRLADIIAQLMQRIGPVQRRLGRESVTAARDRYSHLLPDQQPSAAAAAGWASVDVRE